MDDFYSIPVNSDDSKYGLGLTASDLETFQFPTLGGELGHEQLLALDDPTNFYLAFPETGVFGSSDNGTSRASSAVTPQSECSTRTTLSASNISPTSDILSFHDQPTSQDIEAMYHDTTQSIISGRQSRAASTTWSSASNGGMGLNSTLTPPSRPTAHRPQSLSFHQHQVSHQEGRTPPPPSSFFPSPSIQAQTTPVRSPFLSPNLQSPHIPQMQHVPSQNAYMQSTMASNPSSYFAQTIPPQQFQQQLQQQLQLQLQQQSFSLQQPQSSRQHMFSHHQLPSQGNSMPQSIQPYNTNQNMTPPLSNSSVNANSTPTLPNTTGNSSTGYQCFSHGCGGRHFSNWGNLVRHHRERQLRSKAGAKPTCPRCGKGFTRSSARDAHVAGLKCVLGRRRRGGTGVANAAGGAGATGTTTADSTTGGGDNNNGGKTAYSDGDAEANANQDHDDGNGSDGSRDGPEGEGEDDDELDFVSSRRFGSEAADDDDLHHHLDLDLNGGGSGYLPPQQLQLDH